jgi:hypothetical protein
MNSRVLVSFALSADPGIAPYSSNAFRNVGLIESTEELRQFAHRRLRNLHLARLLC